MKNQAGHITQFCRFVNRYEWLIMLLILPITFFSPGWPTLLLIVLPVLLLVRRQATGHFFPVTPYDLAFLLLLFMVLVSLYATFDIWLSMAKIAGVCVAFFLFYTAVSFTRRWSGGLWYLIAFFFLVGVGFATLGLLGVDWPAPFSMLNKIKLGLPVTQTGLLGTDNTINANFLAGAVVMVAPLLLACLAGFGRSLWQNGKIWLLCLCVMTLFLIGVIGATGSRGGLLAFFVALLVMLAIRFKWGRWLLLAVGLISVSLLFYLDLPDIFASGQGGEVGLSGRLEIWSRSILALKDFPFTGISMNGFRQIIPTFYPFFILGPESEIPHAHNQLLQAGLDLGIPGMIAYLAVWVISLGLLWQSWQRRDCHWQQVLLIGLCGSFAAAWMFGIFDVIGLGERPGFVWWLLLAILVAVFDDVISTAVQPDGE